MKNIILLTIDVLRKDVLGCYGNTSRLTPFIDSLQNKCIKFTRAQACGPYTQASFPGILTSSYYLEYGKTKGLSPQRKLVSELLKQAGIVTAAFHSNPYLSDFLGWNRGWDIFYDSMEEEVDDKTPYIKGDVMNGKIAKWLSSYTQHGEYEPFFLWLHYMDVHEPYIPERKYIDIIDPSITIGQDEMYNLFKDVLLKRDVSDKGSIKLLKKLYYAHIREVDDYIKEFYSILKKFALLQDSIIIITADHGDEFDEHGGLSHHDDKLYSELINIPLLIYDSSKDKGEVCDKLISNVDISPTIIHLFGLDPVANFEGYSLLPLADYPEKGCFGEAGDQRSEQGRDIENDIYYYREQDLKVIYRAKVNTWEMYNLKADPKELNNIVNISPDVERLKNKLKPRVRRWTSK